MVAYITSAGLATIVRLKGQVNADRYIGVINNTYIAEIEILGNGDRTAIILQDNCSVQSAKISKLAREAAKLQLLTP